MARRQGRADLLSCPVSPCKCGYSRGFCTTFIVVSTGLPRWLPEAQVVQVASGVILGWMHVNGHLF